MRHRCLIVDDEPLAVEVIADYLGRFDGFEVAATASGGAEAHSVLQREKVDLLFLDIEMPGLKGTDLVRSLSRPPKVIFTTAHREFALEGFELDVLDYLLKPVSFERFAKAIDRYVNSVREGGGQGDGGRAAERFVNVRADRKTLRLPVDGIIYIEGMKDYIDIVSTSGSISTNMTLQGILAQLPPGEFIRIHRSYIVSLARVTAFDSENVETGRKQLPIGRHYRAEVLALLGG